jgi:arylamine N-acetyltransferase
MPVGMNANLARPDPDGPGLAGVLHRLPHAGAGRRGGTAFPLGKPLVAFLQRWIRKLGFVVLALVAVVAFAEQQPAALADDVLGIVSC